MKSFRKLTSILLAVLMLCSVMAVADVSVSASSTVYIDTSAVTTGEEDFYAWVWGSSSTGSWVSMSTGSLGYYEIQLDSGDCFIVARVEAGTTPDWDTTVWNQSENIEDYDGTYNLCTITGWGEGWGALMPYTWSTASGSSTTASTTTQAPTTEAPTEATTEATEATTEATEATTEAPTETTEAPTETTTQTIPTDPTAADEDEYLYVSAKSNLNTTTNVKTKFEGDLITVTYVLDCDDALDGGQAEITYDSSKITPSATYNTAANMFPVVTDAYYNLNAGVGSIMFNFSGTDGKYDFSGGKTLVTLVFEKKDSAVGTAMVYLNITDLYSKSTTYIEDGTVISTEGVSVDYAVSEDTYDTPTDAEVSTGDADVQVNLTSNLNSETVTQEVTDTNVKVTFSITAAEMIAYGDVSVSYDPDKLALESKYNTEDTMFTTLSSGVVYNLNAGTGLMTFNFTGVNTSTQTGLYDFTNGGELVTLVFTIVGGSYGTTSIELIINDLGSFDTAYVDNGQVTEAGATALSLSTVAVSEDATVPTSTASDSSTDTNPTGDSTSVTTSTDDTSSTDSTDATTVTEPTTSTQPSTSGASPKLTAKKSKLKAGKTVKVKVKNKPSGSTVKFSSTKKKIAKVNKTTGKVTALKKGTTTIKATITYSNGSKKVLKKKIKVTSNPKLKYKKKVIKKKITVKKGKKATIKIKGKAKTVKNKYKVKKKKIAKITTKSKKATKVKIKGLKKGKTKVIIRVNGKKLKFKVKVK